MLHVHRPHAPHPHVHPGFDEHPWRMLPALLSTIVVYAALLIGVSYAIAKIVSGHAY